MLEHFCHSLDGLVGYLRARPRARMATARQKTRSRRISRLLVGLEELDDRIAPATFTVTNTGDNGGVNPTPGQGTGTLRQAIVDANAAPGADVIDFSVFSGGPATIFILSALPSITDTVSIDGTTQPFFAGTPIIVLDGTKAVGSSGLVVTNNAGTSIRGLVISNFDGAGIAISSGSSGVTIAGNYIGTDIDGTSAAPNKIGIQFASGALGGDTIGGPNPADRNLISGNASDGIAFEATADAVGPTIQNNFIGTNAAGTAAIGNGGAGVNLTASTGTVTGTQILGNVISGNASDAIALNGTPGVADLPGVIVRGNLIGTTADGKAAIGNFGSGVFISDVSGTIVGGPAAADRNIISASGVDGVYAPGLSVAGPVVQNNYIGTDITGTVALGNAIHGVDVSTGSGNVTGLRIIDNLISASGAEGIILFGGVGTDIPNAVIQGNFIGTNATGTAALGNRASGIRASGISGLQIGGTKAGQGNVISGNAATFGAGVLLTDVTNATLEGNRIGTTADGSAALPNPNGGISITASAGATSVVIGGTGAKAGNLVVQTGTTVPTLSVTTSGTGTALVTILGNRITGFTNGIRFNSAASSPTVNEGIAAPTLRPATAIPGGVRITGTFTGMPNQQYRIEYFSDQNFATLLGSQIVTTDGAGVAALSFDAAGAFPAGTAFSAIATRVATGASSVYALTVPPAPPVTNPDSFTTLQNQTLTVPAPGVLTNDTDPEGGPLTATLQTPPPATQGTVTVNPDGSFTFVPAAGFFGQTSFTYLATNSAGLSTPGNVTITVTQTVFPPVAVNQNYTTGQGVTLVVPPPGVLTGATGGSGPLSAVLICGLTPAEAGTLTLNSDGSFTYVPDPAFTGLATFQYAATDGVLTSNQATVTITVTVTPPFANRLIAAGAGAGGPPRVRVFDPNGKAVFDFLAFEENFTGGVRVATGDVTGDGTDDIVVAAGPTGGPRVRVFDGRTGQLVRDFFAYNPEFRGGVYVAVGDVTGDGIGDIMTGAGSLGAPHVMVFDGATGAAVRSFFAYSPAFLGGVRVAAGDLNGDGIADLVTVPGPGGGPHVRAFDGATGAELASFFAVDSAYQAGLFVSVIPAHGESGRGSIVVGRDSFPDFEGSIFVFLNDPGTGGAGLPTTASTLTGPATIGVFGFNPAVPGGVDDPATTTAYPDEYLGGVRVASSDDGQGNARIVAAPGQNGGSLIRVFDFGDGEFSLVNEFPAFDPAFTGSVYVG